MPIAVELQAKGAPGGNPQIAKPQLGVQKIEVIVKTHTGGGFQEGLTRGFVIPRLIRAARFHRRKNVHQPELGAPFLEQGSHPIFLAKVVFADEFDGELSLSRDRFRLGADLISQGLRPARIVENPDVVRVEITGRTLRIAEGTTLPWIIIRS